MVSSNAQAKEKFKQLEQTKPETEAALGEKLEWQELPGRKGARIALYKLNADPSDESDWPNQHEWLASNVVKFKSVFRPLVKSIL